MCNLQEGVFSACFNLTHGRLPQGLVVIPKALFMSCSALVDINVPSTVTNGQIYWRWCVCWLHLIGLSGTLERVRFVGYGDFGGELCEYNSLVNFCLPPSHELLDPVDAYDFIGLAIFRAIIHYKTILTAFRILRRQIQMLATKWISLERLLYIFSHCHKSHGWSYFKSFFRYPR
jgi:hypothetical protein